MRRSAADRWLLRADASASIGVGHVMRCLTLGESVVATGRSCCILSHDLPAPLARRAADAGVEVVAAGARPGSTDDGLETAGLADDGGVDVVVFDGYHLGAEVRRPLGGHTAVTVCIDDNLETDPRDVNVVVNHAPHARASDYDGRADLVLLGPTYALVRSEIRRLIPVERTGGEATRVVVTMGGADVLRATSPLCEAIIERTDLVVEAITGLANPHARELRDLASHSGGRMVAVDPDDLPSALARCDLGVVAAGGTLWEASAVGLPTVAVVTADNQLLLAGTPEVHSFATVHDLRTGHGMARIVADVEALASDGRRRTQMSNAATELVDGRGAERVVDAVLAFATGPRAEGSRRAGR